LKSVNQEQPTSASKGRNLAQRARDPSLRSG
jgi:hypothetical protein